MPAIRQWPLASGNGVQLQFSSIELAISGVYFPWITEVDYNFQLDPGEQHGASPMPMGVTLGNAKTSGSISVHRIYRDDFLKQVSASTGSGFMMGFFKVTVVYQEFGWANVEIDEFQARLTGMDSSMRSGNSPLESKFPLYIAPDSVAFNKRRPISNGS